MQTLIPQSASARAKPLGKAGRWLGFGLTPLALGLFGVGLVMAVPAFFHARQIYFMLGWDGLVALLVVFDAVRLPRPEQFVVTRTFLDSPQLGQATRVELGVRHDADGVRPSVIDVRVVDDLHPALVAVPVEQRVEAFPREDVVSLSTIYPRERGDFGLGRVYLRYRGALRLVERWAVAEPVVAVDRGAAPETHVSKARHGAPGIAVGGQQRVRVFPAHEDSRESTQFYLLRARQIELEKRKLQLRGVGREFESLRDYQPGDELRKISWTATARRGRLVTRQFTVERSQQVWMMLDAGRLSRTAFELRRGGVESSARDECRA